MHREFLSGQPFALTSHSTRIRIRMQEAHQKLSLQVQSSVWDFSHASYLDTKSKAIM